METIKKLLGNKATGWVTTVLSIAGLLYVLIAGGTTTQTFTGKDGSVYEAKLVIPAGVMTLIDACDLKVEGQTCPVGINLDVTLKTKGTGSVTPEPAKPAEAPAVETKEETPPVEAKPDTAPVEVKTAEPVKVEVPVKPEETKNEAVSK